MKVKINFIFIFKLLLITSVFLSVSVFVVVPYKSILNLSNFVILLLFVFFLLYNKLNIHKSELGIYLFFLVLIFYSLILISFYNTELIGFKNFRTKRVYYTGDEITYYSEMKKGIISISYFIYALITVYISLTVLKKIKKKEVIKIISKYVHYFSIIYISIYFLNLIGIDLTYFINSNDYYGNKNFLTYTGEVWNGKLTSIIPVRLGITLPEPSYSAMYMLFLYPFTKKEVTYKKYTWLLLLICILLTGSKYAFIFLIVIFLAEIFFKYIFLYPLYTILTLVLFGFITIYIAPWVYESFYDKKFETIYNSQTFLNRTESMRIGLEMFWQNLPFGVGPGRFSFNFNKYKYVTEFTHFEGYYPNNSYILYLAEYGILMIPLYLYMLKNTVVAFLKRNITYFLLNISILFAFLGSGLFYHTYFILFMMINHYLLYAKDD